MAAPYTQALAGAGSGERGRAATVLVTFPAGESCSSQLLAALNRGEDAGISSVSCGSVEHCSAGGGYAARHAPGHYQAFVVNQA